MTLYRAQKILFATGICFFLLLSFAVNIEVFPIFSWKLFEKVSTWSYETVLIFDELNNEILDAPRFYFDHFPDGDMTVYVLLFKLKNAIASKNTQNIKKYKNIIEETFFDGIRQARYKIHIRKYQAFSFFYMGQYYLSAPIAEYEFVEKTR